MSQHSHEVGAANMAFTRRGRRAQAASKSALGSPHPATPQAATAGPSQLGMSGVPQPIAQAGQVAGSVQAQPDPQPAFFTPYPHFPSMTMPLPQGLGGVVPLHSHTSTPAPALSVPVPAAQTMSAAERERMVRERWERMDVLYQSIRNNANQFDYPAASVAALESVLVRMYFESPISAPQHPQPHPVSFPLTQSGHPQHPGHVNADNVDSSDSSSGSEEGDDE